ncbi:transcription initiation factor IIF subunit alpha [Ceratobasidium sp. AG-Ba]|nr:transcription initiation factor IIF subunit alpha [Ceratobasidium sp. AG-Ba]
MSRQLKRIPIPEPKKRRPPPGKQAPAKRETGSAGPATSDPPLGRYTDYSLLSSKHSDKKWDVFRLQTHSEVPIDLNTWPQPVKLNRKDYKSPNEIEEQAGPLTPMLGPDGKPVIGPDGKIVMLNADGTRVKKEEDTKGKKKAKEDPKKKAFMKKTRQVHMIPDEVRAFRKEHRKDWLLEDNGGGLAANQSWSGKYADSNDKRIWAFFAPVPGNEKEFRFIPVHRFYNFTRNNNVSTERVENQHARMQAAKTNAKTKPKKEEEDEKPIRGIRKLKLVNHGNDLFGDDEAKPRLGGEGDYDEVEYEDEVQDDEEVPADAVQDEEEKEAAERQKREYRRDKVSERVEPESDEEEDDGKGYTEDGRQLKKLMKKMLNESDDEKNPYADSDDEEEEEDKLEQPQAVGVMPNTPTPAQPQSGTSTPRPQGSQSVQPGSQAQKLSTSASATTNASRSGSPSMGGAALLAQRATSPHPIRKSPSVGSNIPNNRATTPLSPGVPAPASGGSANGKKRKDRPSDRGGTPTPPQKRPTPTPQTPPGGRASTPTGGANGQKKKKSKHDLVAPNGDPLPEVITEQHAIEYLRKMGGAVQTSECITYFKRALKHDPENQRRLTDALKKVSTQAQKGYIKLNAPWA